MASSLVRCSSLSASGELLCGFGGVGGGGGGGARRPALLPRGGGAAASGGRRMLRVRAEQLPSGGGSPTPPAKAGAMGRFLQRYDPVATGVGALAVTGWCAMHGQPVAEALNIAAAATVLGMVAQEVLFVNAVPGDGKEGGEEDEPRA